jgi:uncharacterized protein (TIGR03083 family)
MSHVAPFERHLEAISVESVRLAAVTAEALDRKVPSCPEWTGRDLIDHLWHVHTFWHAQVRAGDETARRDPGERAIPEGEQVGDWLEEAGAGLVDDLADAGPDAPCWNWSGHDLNVRWVARRMALETAVHRFDGELTGSDPTPIETDLAVDGIDEFLRVHLQTDVPETPEATLGGTLCLACSDSDDAWIVEIGGGQLRVREGSGPATACLRGTASDLYLFTWNRIGVDDLELTGDRSVAAAWATLPG